MACYRPSGPSAYRVHAIIRLPTATSLTQGAAQPREPLSTAPSCRAVLVGPTPLWGLLRSQKNGASNFNEVVIKE